MSLTEILIRKENGIDCTEDESAYIKQFIKREWLKKGVYITYIDQFFPCECSEALEEFDQGL